MRRVFDWLVRGCAAVTVIAVLSASVSAAPRGGDREKPKDKGKVIAKFLKNIVRALGDGLTIPNP